MARRTWRRGSAAQVWRLGLTLCGLLALPVLAQPAADTVILGGKVVTVDPSFSLARSRR